MLEAAKANPDYISMMFAFGLLVQEREGIQLKAGAKKTEEFKKAIKTQKFRTKVSPYIDLDRECGFLRVANIDKRFDAYGEDCRESILAGAYVTMWSRWKLLSTLKGEMDNGNVILYSDTDSLKFLQINPPKFTCHKSELGA